MKVVDESTPVSKVNIPQLMGTEDGTVLAPTYNWQEFFSPAIAWHQVHGTFSLLRRSSRYGVLQNDHRWCRGDETAGNPAASE